MNTLPGIIKLSTLNCLHSLTDSQLTTLNKLGIWRLSDLLHFKPLVNARLLMQAAKGELTFDIKKSFLLKKDFESTAAGTMQKLSIVALEGITEDMAKILLDNFQVKDIESFSKLKCYAEAEDVVAKYANMFSEPASAPEELMPKIIGSVASQYSYSNFVKESRLRFAGLELLMDNQRVYVDKRLTRLFIVPKSVKASQFDEIIPEVTVGYISKITQKWINYGTHLGEVIHSLPLAPGESRNIAVIDWKSKQTGTRKEDTKSSELLTNELFHKRALDEVARSTAIEHQSGGTDIGAATIAGSIAGVAGAGLVAGIAGALPGAAIGGVIGAGTGGVVLPVVGAIPGVAVGALAGAVVGFGVGGAIGVGGALMGAANAQLGTIQSDSNGDRGINARTNQNIDESIQQKSSSIRSLWSSVIVTDEQAESENLSTRNITNYNHSHALTIQYFEVLQHYKTELCLTQAEPFLLLPFNPLEFTYDFILEYWSILKNAVQDKYLLDSFDKLINQTDQESADPIGTTKLDLIQVHVQRPSNQSSGLASLFAGTSAQVSLVGKDIVKTANVSQGSAMFSFKDEVPAENLTGIQVLNLANTEQVYISIFGRMLDGNNQRVIKRIRQEQFTASADGIINISFSLVENNLENAENVNRLVVEIEKYFNSHRYHFTRVLLCAIEKEQLVDVVESLMLRVPIEVSGANYGAVTGAVAGAASAYLGLPTEKNNKRVADDASYNSSGVNRTYSSVLSEQAFKNLSGILLNERLPAGFTAAQVREKYQELLSRIYKLLQKQAAEPPKTDAAKNKIIEQIVELVKEYLVLQKIDKVVVLNVLEDVSELFNKLFAKLEGFNAYNDYIHLSEFIDTTPFAITGNTLMFKMKKITDPDTLQNTLLKSHQKIKALSNYPDDIKKFVQDVLLHKEQHTVSNDVFLPTSGVFAEAILGRSNASEKIDISRYINWQDMPIPNSAPLINALSAGLHTKTPLDITPTVPGNVLNVVNPPAFPDPTGMSAVLSAIQNGNIFRDMSKSDQLVTVMSNLSSLAQNMATQAGTLAGQAQSDALKAATEIGKQVAQLAGQAASQSPNAPKTSTEKGGTANAIEKLLANPGSSSQLAIPNELKTALGINGVPAGSPGSGSGTGSPVVTVPGILPPNSNTPGNERDGVVNNKPANLQIKDILDDAVSKSNGEISEENKTRIVSLMQGDYTKNIKPLLEANTADFVQLKPALKKFIDWMAQGQLLGVGDALKKEADEGLQLAKLGMFESLSNAVDRAIQNNDVAQVRLVLNITETALLLGFDEPTDGFLPDSILGKLNLSLLVSSSFDRGIKNGEERLLKVNVLLKIGSNSGTPIDKIAVRVDVAGGTALPFATGRTNEFGNFNCNIQCTDRAALNISGLADSGLPDVAANFSVNLA